MKATKSATAAKLSHVMDGQRVGREILEARKAFKLKNTEDVPYINRDLLRKIRGQKVTKPFLDELCGTLQEGGITMAPLDGGFNSATGWRLYKLTTKKISPLKDSYFQSPRQKVTVDTVVPIRTRG